MIDLSSRSWSTYPLGAGCSNSVIRRINHYCPVEKCKLLQTSCVAQWIVIYPLTCDQAFIHSLALSTFLVEQVSQNTPSLALPCRGAGPRDRGFVVYGLFIG